MTLGRAVEKTQVKNNAGGNVDFNQIVSFQKESGLTKMKVEVMDSDTLSDDLLGVTEVDLTKVSYAEDLTDIKRGIAFECKQGDKVVGKVYLAFGACVIHCHVLRIENFSNTAGFMGRNSPMTAFYCNYYIN